MQATKTQPNLPALLQCVEEIAVALGQEPLELGTSAQMLESLLFTAKDRGGREICATVDAKLITRREARDLLLGHIVSRLSSENDAALPTDATWASEKLLRRVEQALFTGT